MFERVIEDLKKKEIGTVFCKDCKNCTTSYGVYGYEYICKKGIVVEEVITPYEAVKIKTFVKCHLKNADNMCVDFEEKTKLQKMMFLPSSFYFVVLFFILFIIAIVYSV